MLRRWLRRIACAAEFSHRFLAKTGPLIGASSPTSDPMLNWRPPSARRLAAVRRNTITRRLAQH